MIVIIDYKAGNKTSVENAIKRLGYAVDISSCSEKIQNAEKVIFPGVGEASSAMGILKSVGLDEVIKDLKQPVLGICLGMQLMCESSEEGKTEGLSIFKTNVKRFPSNGIVPQIGWNTLSHSQDPLMEGIEDNVDVYFVHSYYAEICADTRSVCDYIKTFSAVLQRDNFYGTQFHPEKSGEVGEIILNNFLKL